jgi:hypothetical protein
MSYSAVIPASQLQAANDALEAQGFGPRNFSIPVYAGSHPTHATLHSWTDSAFLQAVQAIPNVIVSSIGGDSTERIEEAITAADPLAGWAGNAKPLEGQVTPGLHRAADGVLWWVIQPYDTAVWSNPAIIPALIRRARVPGEVAPWVQPLDQFDAYKLVNAFTGQPDRVTHNGQTWRVTQADGAGNNVWEPGVFGWTAD